MGTLQPLGCYVWGHVWRWLQASSRAFASARWRNCGAAVQQLWRGMAYDRCLCRGGAWVLRLGIPLRSAFLAPPFTSASFPRLLSLSLSARENVHSPWRGDSKRCSCDCEMVRQLLLSICWGYISAGFYAHGLGLPPGVQRWLLQQRLLRPRLLLLPL